MERPTAAIVLLACGGLFSLYFSVFATSLDLGCSPGVVRACAVYWGLVGLSWAVGAAGLGLAVLLVPRPRLSRIAGVVGVVLPGLFLTSLAFLLRSTPYTAVGVLIVAAIFLWPYVFVLAGGILALLWRPREPRPPGGPPPTWPPPPSGVPSRPGP
jgi:hypothetical protein